MTTIPKKSKDSAGGPWEFVGLLPLFDPHRHDCVETIRKALDLGFNVKMITSDQLIIGKEIGQHKDESIAPIPIDELIEKPDGFAGVFPGDGVNDALALKRADIAVADAIDAARGASDIVLIELGLSVIVSAILASRAIF
ncbi:unnamed protein product [Ilex paraguariensis]|uniref:Uncharacterized protein n=1 Tax=Ilex paraguariensis TaxID=185542 RepID=A0ABC8RSQ8_9AQUA